MTRNTLEPPSSDLRILFEAEAAFHDEDRAMKQRVWGRVESIIEGGPDGGGEGGSDGDGGGRAAIPAGAARVGAAVTGGALGKYAAVAVAAFVAGGGAGAALYRAAVAPPEPRVIYVAAPAPTASVPDGALEAPDAAASAAAAPGAAPDAGARRLPAPVVEDVGSPAAADSARSQLAREREIIDAARAAIARGHGDAALEAVERHARDFPGGRLAQEREGLRIIALVRAGRRAEAQRRAEQFREVYPNSVLLPAIDAVLGK